ncbi:integral membrane domain protein [Mycobacterium xenopi 4042]|uniref:Integral membrane domain protein n=1 Tax=Mycobacterium xenopi 4042 TaxID=1299334 RepID=X8CLN8_MYCXE|nr:integral membrane domain protein [Mycobacterium xenopi 4042]
MLDDACCAASAQNAPQCWPQMRVAACGRRGRALAWVSLVFLAIEAAVGLWQGLAAGSVALTGWALVVWPRVWPAWW